MAAGAKTIKVIIVDVIGTTNNNKKETPKPIPNKIKSSFRKMPNINLPRLVLAGIK